MFTLMRDPVILPSSKVTIDRPTIKSHLLSDTKDPFNRAPLKLEDVVPGSSPSALIVAFPFSQELIADTELKAKIDAFVAERRKQLTANTQAAVAAGKMDVSED